MPYILCLKTYTIEACAEREDVLLHRLMYMMDIYVCRTFLSGPMSVVLNECAEDNSQILYTNTG